MPRPSRRRVAAAAATVAAAAAGSALVAPPAAADSTFRTERFPLEAVGGEPLRSGAVIDIHAEGPRVYALERYQLNGARPGATYQVTLLVYADPDCATDSFLFPVPTDTMTTNRAGNAHGSARFTPQDVEGLDRTTYGIVWEVSRGGTLAYTTGCRAVALD